MTFDYANGTPVLDDFDLHLRPGETVALVGRTGTGKSTVGTAARSLLRRHRGRGAHRRPRRARPHAARACATTSGWCSTSRSSSRCRSATTSPTASPTPPFEDVEAAAARRRRRRVHPRAARGLRHRGGGARASPSPVASASGSSIARTLLVNPPILVLDDATSAIDVQIEQQIHAALEPADDRAHHADHRPPALDHQPGRPRRGRRGRTGHRARARTPSCWPPSRATPRSSPRPNKRRTTGAGDGNGDGRAAATATDD